jgi:L-threonine ammonia-lyase (EC 4.3.1.19)
MAAKHTDYLQRILNARVYDVAIESALEPARNLSRRLHNKVLFKREDTQPVFSFKLARGVQQDVAADRGRTQARRDLRVGGQPRAGRGAVGAPAGLPRGDCDAGYHAEGENRRGARWRRQRGRGAAGRKL